MSQILKLVGGVDLEQVDGDPITLDGPIWISEDVFHPFYFARLIFIHPEVVGMKQAAT